MFSPCRRMWLWLFFLFHGTNSTVDFPGLMCRLASWSRRCRRRIQVVVSFYINYCVWEGSESILLLCLQEKNDSDVLQVIYMFKCCGFIYRWKDELLAVWSPSCFLLCSGISSFCDWWCQITTTFFASLVPLSSCLLPFQVCFLAFSISTVVLNQQDLDQWRKFFCGNGGLEGKTNK